MKNKLFLLIVFFILLISTKGSAQNLSQSQLSWDPDLESGFPVTAYFSGGTYQGGPVINTLVGNFDNDMQLEIAFTSLATGPLYIWNSDSSLLPGWQRSEYFGAAYPAAGNLTGTAQSLEIVSAYWSTAGIFAYGQDGEVLPGWPTQPHCIGYAPAALADVNHDGYDEIFFPCGGQIAGLKADGTDLPGWPAGLGQIFHTPAIGDIDNDGGLEIVSATDPVNGIISLHAFNDDGSVVTGFPVFIYGYNDTFPVIGDVDEDGNLEVIVVGGGGITRIYVYSGNGNLESTMQAIGTEAYGPAPSLADLDNDSFPEIIVATVSAINIWDGDGTQLPGWPVSLLQQYSADFVPLVGDIDGDQALEIIVWGVDGAYAFTLDGKLEPRFPKASNGMPGAIADIDMDGHNEIIATDGMNTEMVFPNWIRVFDLGGPPHGKIEWGQFGGGPEHSGVYPVPQPPSPPQPPLSGELTYIPMINRTFIQPSPELHGRVVMNSSSASDVPLELRFYNGSTWSTIARPTTSSDGTYVIRGVPNLADGQAYSFRYTNSEFVPGRLFSWSTRPIYNYTETGNVGFSEFDISDLPLDSPPSGLSSTLPVTFTWIKRTTPLSDWYAFVLFDPTDGDPSLIAYPYKGTNGVILNSLPPGFTFNTLYAWSIWIISPEGAIGVPSETRYITFLPSGQVGGDIENDVKSSPIDWKKYPNLPCEIYTFLPQCGQN